MRNSRVIAILGMASVALSAFIVYYYYYFFMVPQYGMGGMMMHHMFSPTPPYNFLVIIGLAMALVVSIVGLIYYALASPPRPLESCDDGLEAVMKVLKPEERKVLEAIIKKGGRALQKEVRKETGLSRLRLHRIVQRLAERGIIKIKEVGNTNELTVVDWLKKEIGG